MPAPIYERSDGSKATNRCEGWTLYGGVESWQGFPREHPAPGTGKRVSEHRASWRANTANERNKIFGGVVGMGGVLPVSTSSAFDRGLVLS